MSGKVGSASFGVLLIDGYDVLAAKPKGFTHKIEAVQENTLGLGDATESKTPVGVVKLTISQSGAFFDDATNGVHALLSPLANQQVSRSLCAAFAGNTIGAEFLGASGVYGQSYDVLGQSTLLTKANVGYQVTGTLDRGSILNQSVAKTIDWNTKTDGFPVDYTTDTSQQNIPIASATKANPCVVTTSVPHGLTTGQLILTAGNSLAGPSINSEQAVTVVSTTTFSVAVNTSASTGAGTGGSFVRSTTINGGAGYLMVSALSGFTGFIGKIRSSPDNITYTDLITFTNVTSAPSSERKTVAGTVPRYLCFDGDVTGAGSITVFVGFARL